MNLTLREVANVLGGRLAEGSGSQVVRSVTIDSRKSTSKALFFAFKGSAGDGHDFASEAIQRGAAGVVALRVPERVNGGEVVLVDDVPRALTSFASWVRDSVDPITVGITGSVGKTTTKELLASIARRKFNTVVAERSFNTEITVPLTLLQLSDDSELLITELGSRGPGQIAHLCKFVRPQVGVVTNIGKTHGEMFGSEEAIALEKSALIKSLPPGGTAILNADDDRVSRMGKLTDAQTVSYGLSSAADVRAEKIRLDRVARPTFRLVSHAAQAEWVSLSLSGAHQVPNALAATAAGLALGLSSDECRAGLESSKAPPWRMQITESAGITFINDAYNSGPASARAALETAAQIAGDEGRVFAVLGHMAELGDVQREEHRRLGAFAAPISKRIVIVGSQASEILEGARATGATDLRAVADPAGVIDELRDLESGDVVLVKASRIVGLEGVVGSLMANLSAKQ